MTTTAQSIRIGGFEITDANGNGIIDDSDRVSRHTFRGTLQRVITGGDDGSTREIGRLEDLHDRHFEGELQRLGIRALSGAPFRALEEYRESLRGAQQAMISGNVAGVELHLRIVQANAGAVNSGVDFDELNPLMIELVTKWQECHESSVLFSPWLNGLWARAMGVLVPARVPYEVEKVRDVLKCNEIIERGGSNR